ncbi:GM13809 [Drosophila sechellia]|uniref:GM13809 n=1 Tax=Drosophila sechellia TaxID=7238 RepID=B4HUZ2_DROSE|nr:GM13809 [Drosophila sechellia]
MGRCIMEVEQLSIGEELPKCPPRHLAKLVSMASILKMLQLVLPQNKRTES